MIAHRSLGCDPGADCGYGIVDISASASLLGRPVAVSWGILDAGDPASHLRRLLLEYRPGSVGIETVEQVHQVRRKGVDGISTSQALALYQSGVVAGQLLREARLWTPTVHLPTAERWRKDIVGNTHASDADIDRVLRLRLGGFPAPRKSSNHERDGLGVALHTGLAVRMQKMVMVAR